MNTQSNAKLLATPRAMALAIILILTSSGPLCATDYRVRFYVNTRGTIQHEARAGGLSIDTDVDALVEATGEVVLATIDGFENIVLDDTGLNEFDWGFAGVVGIAGLPDGFYRLHYIVDLSQPENAIALLINSLGEVFTFPLAVMDDPHPERGPRKGLTSEGGAPVADTLYVTTRNGRKVCLEQVWDFD